MYESLIRTLRCCWADIGAIAVAADALEALEACNNALREQLAGVTAERDSAINRTKELCYLEYYGRCETDDQPCDGCASKWRGQKEER